VGPNLALTQHAITIRPICFSLQTFQRLPPDLQAAIRKAGVEAGAYGRQVESSEDAAKLEALAAAGKMKVIPFADRDALKKLVDPVIEAYAAEIGADKILADINAVQ
jgi:TRAP-type transport system periplasmic protein